MTDQDKRINYRLAWLALFIVLAPLHVIASDDSSILPLPYVTYSERDFDLHVMDLNTGEIIVTVSTEQYDCPLSLSPDKQWLLYSQGSNFPDHHSAHLYHFEAGTTLTIPHIGIVQPTWSPDNRPAGTAHRRLHSISSGCRW
jgi:hypothetical protein